MTSVAEKTISPIPAAENTRTDDQSCRSILNALEGKGELLVVDKPVSAKFDVSAMLSLADHRAAVRFDKIEGSDIRLFGNLLTSRERIAMALGVSVDQIQKTLTDAVRNPIKPEIIDNAPVQEVVVRENVLAGLPVPHFFQRETGPYISAGMIIAKDPETGLGNASYARLKVLNENEAMIGIAPNHHLAIMARKAAAMGKPLPFAVVLGAHPAIQLAACLYLGLGDDEMENAGALLGAPVRMAKTVSSDLLVPAEAEVVLEGLIHSDRPLVEGPVSEYHGMYEDYGSGLICTFQARTNRADAMFQVIEPGYHAEHIFIAAVPIAASLKAQLSRALQNVGDVAVTATGSGRNDVIVQLKDPRPGQARRAMAICWGAVSIIKNVTIIDADVDPWDLAAVELAKMTRMRAERDVLIISDLPADRSEAQEDGGVVAKIGYDATMKAGDRSQGYDKALPPEDAYARMRSLLSTIRPDLLP